jgi:hypothetical protein
LFGMLKGNAKSKLMGAGDQLREVSVAR